MKRILDFARQFRMDNPLTNFGSDVYQPKEPINITVDAFAPLAAFVRGLFEYLYSADALTLHPHIPAGVTELHQKFPIRFGPKRLFLSTAGTGPVTIVRLNGRPWPRYDAESITLPYADLPDEAVVEIFLGEARPAKATVESKPLRVVSERTTSPADVALSSAPGPVLTPELAAIEAKTAAFLGGLSEAGLGETYEAADARLVLGAVGACRERRALLARGVVAKLPAVSQAAADQSYVDAALRLGRGLDALMGRYKNSGDAQKLRICAIYNRGGSGGK